MRLIRTLAARRAVLVVVLGAGVLTAIVVLAAMAASGGSSGKALPITAAVPAVKPGSDYLAIGDSVAFGFREPTTVPAPDYHDAASFVGYPEDVAAELHLHVTNASCPGETSASLINASAQSNGCENSITASGKRIGLGYRTAFPLHVSYRQSQLAFALAFLKTHPKTRLVSLMIGANDAFICEDTTADHCIAPRQLDPVLASVTRNVGIILAAIRTKAQYRGQIVIVNYYSLNYANAFDNAASHALNSAVDAGARPYRVEIAHGYQAFAAAATYSGNDSCTAGLLTQLSTGGCGVHPSPSGQSVLAEAVDAAVTP
ncbi:MAG: GDSL-type esterase/lipase family protein [Actinomycetota bacterium]|nr:GDSL-type esterase/lipase family protein [Actinomycetota bacterium]